MASTSSAAECVARPPTSSFGGVPLDSEEGRHFLQRRLAFFAGLSAAMVVGFFFALNLLFMTGGEHPPSLWLSIPSNQLHLAAMTILVIVWLAARSGRRSAGTLQWLDGFGTVFVCVFYGLSGFADLPWKLPDAQASPIILATTTTLIGRAILVPSSPRRTLVVTVLGSVPAVVALFHVFGRGGPAFPLSAPVLAAMGSLWVVVGAIMSTLTSRVIYGLQERVREAMQLGQYALEEKIGEGGMGIVWRASHAMLRRPTAIKLLPPEKSGEAALLRFEREVQLTARLTHPNTVSIFDYGRTPDGVFYYAMELLDGIDLERLVRADGPMPPARVVHVLRQVAGALAEAHGIGLIHRDIKPANILLCRSGGLFDVAKVVDFGLVKHVGQSDDLHLTNVNAIAGTPLFLPPEAITAPETVDAKSDLYALGAVAYFMVTGKPVFEGATLVEVCSHHLLTPPVRPSERLGRPLPADLESVILSCLEKDPSRRPPTARALDAALGACGCAHDWTDEHQAAWWSARSEAVRSPDPSAADARAAAATPSAVLARTVAVDLRARRA